MACGGGVRCRVAVCLAPHSTPYYSTKDGAGVRTVLQEPSLEYFLNVLLYRMF